MGEDNAGGVIALPADGGDDGSGTTEDRQEISAVIDQVAALRSEIDRLIALVNSASEKIGNQR